MKEKLNYNYFAISAKPICEEQNQIMCINHDLTLPTTTKEALVDPTWKKSMDDEIKAQIEKHTWELAILLLGVNIIGSKWTHILKKDQKGTIIHAKSRLVAQGFTQTFGEDYEGTIRNF